MVESANGKWSFEEFYICLIHGDRQRLLLHTQKPAKDNSKLKPNDWYVEDLQHGLLLLILKRKKLKVATTFPLPEKNNLGNIQIMFK